MPRFYVCRCFALGGEYLALMLAMAQTFVLAMIAQADVNIASFASVYTVPSACTDARYITDGDERTFAALEPCGNMAGSYVFEFEREQTVHRIRFLQRDGAYMKRFALQVGGKTPSQPANPSQRNRAGDSEASFRTVVEHGAAVGWNELNFEPPITARVFCLRALEGKSGWMQSFPNLFEVEIWAKGLSGQAPSDVKRRQHKLPQLQRKHKITIDGGERHLPSAVWLTPNHSEILKGIWVEAWMVGRPRTEQSRKLLDSVRELGANVIWLWAQAVGSKQAWRVLWKSEVAEGLDSEWLTEFIKEAHEHEIKVIVTLYDDSQGEGIGVRFKDRVTPMPPHACSLNGEWYRQRWSRVFAEAVQRGADGVALCPDEFYHGGHWLAKMSDDDPCHALFRKAYGYERAPNGVADIDQFRRWQVFVYESIGDILRSHADAVRRVNQSVITTCNISPGAYSSNLQMRLGLAYDAIFGRANIELPGTDPYAGGEYRSRLDLRPIVLTKLFSAASPTGKCTALLNAGYFAPRKYERPFPLYAIYGNALSALFCDAKLIVWYRHNYIFGEWQGVDLESAVKRTSAIMDEICRLGFERSRTPKRIAVVYSRASEDWWQLKFGGHYTLPNLECIRGYVHHKTVIEWLIRCGYQFDVLYGERSDKVKRISDYDAIILPFPFAISDSLTSALELAVQRGKHLLIFGSLGERDEFGNERKEHALERLLQTMPSRVTFVERDLMRWGMTGHFRSFLCRWIDLALGGRKDWHFDPHGHDAIMLLREGEDGSRFILLVNYEPKPVTVEVGVRMSVSRSRIVVLDADATYEGKFDRPLTQRAVNRFAATIPPEAALVICVLPTFQSLKRDSLLCDGETPNHPTCERAVSIPQAGFSCVKLLRKVGWPDGVAKVSIPQAGFSSSKV